MNPFISEDQLRIKIYKIFDDYLQKVHAVILEAGAELEHAGEVEHMNVNIAELVRVVLLEAVDDGALVVGVLEELSEAEARLLGGGGVDEGFYEQVVDDLARLPAFTSVDSEHLEEERLVVREGGLKPVDSMQKKI